MRLLGLVVCCLLLAGCTDTASSAPKPKPKPLTAVGALGDFRTLDYCSLLDASGGEPVSSFQNCRLEADGFVRAIGPVNDEGGTTMNPYDYPGKRPPGVVVSDGRGSSPECSRWVTFADRVALWISVTGKTPCDAAADDLVAGVFTAIEDGRVRHVTYGQDSFGSIDPCSLITGPEFVTRDRPPKAALAGHACSYKAVGLGLGIGEPYSGPRETVGGRQAAVAVDGGVCYVLFERPLADRPGLVEWAQVYETDGRGCETARPAAEVVARKLPT